MGLGKYCSVGFVSRYQDSIRNTVTLQGENERNRTSIQVHVYMQRESID